MKRSKKQQEKWERRQAAKWLMTLTNDRDWGLKVWDDLEQKDVPKPVNCKTTLFNFLSGFRFAYPRRLTQKVLIEHFLGKRTVYFTGARGEKTLLMLDIDCHRSGSLEGAKQFAAFLKQHYFPDLYYEVSTNGNGIHGFIIVDIWNWSAVDYNGVLRDAQAWLRRVLATTDFDVEGVELKGRCPVVVWGEDYDRQVKFFTMGGLAKMPREWKRFKEWKATTKMTAHDLRRLPDLYPVEVTVAVKENVKKQASAASFQGNRIDKDRFQKYLPLAQRFLSAPELISAKSRVFVTTEDVATFLVLLEFFGANPNEDGSMPYKRFARLWKRLYEDGDVNRCFDNKKFAWIRNRVSEKGGIDWIDTTYSVGFRDIQGKAAKWKASAELQALMEGYLKVESGANSGIECDNNSEIESQENSGIESQTNDDVLLVINNQPYPVLSGSEHPDLDSLWLQMPITNLKNVGLRPVMVATASKEWTLADHMDELVAAGFGWMAA